MIEVGSRAPDFTLKDQNGKAVRLSSLKGEEGFTVLQTAGLDTCLKRSNGVSGREPRSI